MNKVIQIEDRVSRSRSKHEGESSADVCDRLSRTRVSSQRQLPTDHDYAVSTREYQLDQSSLIPASAAADPALDRNRRPAHLDRSLHINVRLAGDSGETRRLGIPWVFAECIGGDQASTERARPQMTIGSPSNWDWPVGFGPEGQGTTTVIFALCTMPLAVPVTSKV